MATWQRDRPPRHLVTHSVVRMSVVIVVLFGLYAWAPLGQRPEGSVLGSLLLSLVLLAGVVAWQIVAVMRSPFPWLQAVEGIATSVPLLLLPFASIYFVMDHTDPGSFSEPLTRIDALYFSMTVFATVGFGDISPASQATRLLVTIQMAADLILIGLIAKVLVGAAQQRRRALGADAHPADDAGRARES